MEKAIEKLEAEIKDSKEHYVVMVGKCMIDHIKNNPADAAAIMTEGKTVAGSIAFMKAKAKTKATDGYAVFTPDEGFDIIMEYYGLQGETATIKPQEPPKRINLNIDDLL